MQQRPNLTPEKRTAGEWRPQFLAALRNSGNIRASCQAAGVSRQVVYDHRRRSAEFRQQWDEALEDAIDVLEAEARRRAMQSSDTLLIFLLKAHRPEKYSERVRLDVLIRQAAERVAAELGLTADEVIAEAERIAAGRRWF
jgi:hypothetical protein